MQNKDHKMRFAIICHEVLRSIYFVNRQHQTFCRSHIGIVEGTSFFKIATAPDPSVVDDFDLLVMGTPVMGLRPSLEVQAFVKRLPECTGKKRFCSALMPLKRVEP